MAVGLILLITGQGCELSAVLSVSVVQRPQSQCRWETGPHTLSSLGLLSLSGGG